MVGRVKVISLISKHKEILGIADGKDNQMVVYVLRGYSSKVAKLLKSIGVDAKVIEIDEFTTLNNEGGGVET